MIKWRGQFYLVSVEVADGEPSVTTRPENPDLAAAARASVDSSGHLGVYMGFEGNYLLNDQKKGEE